MKKEREGGRGWSQMGQASKQAPNHVILDEPGRDLEFIQKHGQMVVYGVYSLAGMLSDLPGWRVDWSD